MEISDIIAIYGASLSSLIAIVAVARHFYIKNHEKKERLKLQTTLYLLNKIHPKTQKKFPIIVVLLANLGKERISIKGIEYEGKTKGGVKTSGTPGWYEEPEAAYGVMKRLLPVVLESGQTKDLPIIPTGVFIHIQDLKIWLNTFDNKKIYLKKEDIVDINGQIKRANQSEVATP
jgi:hypothetical protein